MEALARRQVASNVQRIVEKILGTKSYTTEIFGSARTGLEQATSDIDIRLMLRDRTGENRKLPKQNERRILKEALTRLFARGIVNQQKYTSAKLRHARYPLITMQHKMSGLEVQIVLANDTSHARSIMQKYMDEYPYIRQVFSVLKAMLDVRGLSDVYTGGIGSYPLFMMLVASLRHSPLPQGQEDAAAFALLNFLRFWGDFDTSKGISIEPVELFDKSERLVMPETVRKAIEVTPTAFQPPHTRQSALTCVCREAKPNHSRATCSAYRILMMRPMILAAKSLPSSISRKLAGICTRKSSEFCSSTISTTCYMTLWGTSIPWKSN